MSGDYASKSIEVAEGDRTPPGEAAEPVAAGGASDRLLSRLRWRWVAVPVATAIALTVLWAVDFFGESSTPPSDPAPPLPAAERFAAALAQIAAEQTTQLHVTDYPVTDEMIAEIAEMTWLETVILDQGAVSDQALETIAALPNLVHLRLRLSPITDRGLEQLSHCESLWYLNLPHADCTSEGVAALARLPRLRQLRLASKHLRNDVTEQIAKIPGLRGIHLIGVPVTDEGLDILANMPHLESLYLDQASVTEAGWQRLFRDHPDLHVHINQRHHDLDPKAHKHHD